jgi:hypothetical protein
MGARDLDPILSIEYTTDPMWYKFPSLSPYNAMGNNPIMYIDPDGRDIVILRNSKGAVGAGHAAILVGNDKSGWTYISKDGPRKGPFGSKPIYAIKKFNTLKEFSESSHNRVLKKGKHSDDRGNEIKYNSSNFKKDKNGNFQVRYDQALLISTTQSDGTSTDEATIQAATESVMSDYIFGINDCSSVITDALNVSKGSDGQPLQNGEGNNNSKTTDITPADIGRDISNARPNEKFDKIKEKNKNVAKEIDL